MGSAVYNVGWSYSGCGYVGGYGYSSGGYNSGGFSGSGLGGYGRAGLRHRWSTCQPSATCWSRRATARSSGCATSASGSAATAWSGYAWTVGSFYGNGLEFWRSARRSAPTAPNDRSEPFTSDLSGQDFAKLIRAGWVPVDLVQGVGAVIRHDDWAQRMQQSSWTNQEMVGSTQLVTAARAAARDSLAEDAAKRGGHTVVLQDMQLNIFETRCAYGGEDAHDHLADAFLWGTAIVPIDPKSAEPDRRCRCCARRTLAAPRSRPGHSKHRKMEDRDDRPDGPDRDGCCRRTR